MSETREGGENAAMRALRRRRLGRTHMEVTELALGGVGIGGLYGPVPEIEAARVIQRALQLSDEQRLTMGSRARALYEYDRHLFQTAIREFFTA